MPQKTVIKSKQFDCPKCNRNVTFRYREIYHFADEFVEPVDKSIDRILDYGRCQIAAEAKIPNHPIHGEIQDCPIYQVLDAR
jgi:hypothetical protein